MHTHTEDNIRRKFIIHNIKVRLEHGKADGYDGLAFHRAEKILRKSDFFRSAGKPRFEIYKKSVDARDRDAVLFVYTVAVSFEKGSCANTALREKLLGICRRENITLSENDSFEIPQYRGLSRPVVCGFGPCGMFAALVLARAGARPIVLERGADADTRVKIVEHFWKTGELSESTNVQFGEGGAGTFSDGKLLTRINDPLCSYVLETFAAHGASPDILVNAKPHVGTDKLRNIVKSIRREIISLGGEVRFCTELTSLEFCADGRNVKIGVNGNAPELITDALFLAPGHSARNTFAMLAESRIEMCAKPFSVGVRIEHLQKDIDTALYGNFAGHPALSPGEYALSCRCGGRAAYTFCMCPGGTVVASASENGTIVTNGMSYSTRSGTNANCAVAVSVSTDDFAASPFAAMEFQAEIERRAFGIAGGNGSAPIQTVGGFFGRTNGKPTTVTPTYTGNVAVCSMTDVFPKFVTDTLEFGLCNFDKKVKGFASDSAVLTAPETRTSSPVKLPRGEDRRAVGHYCVYTCGEGAGYAGGITSAAVDGMRSALAFLANES